MTGIDMFPKADMLSDHEIDTITAEITKTISDLHAVRQSIAKDIIGENTFKRASFLLLLLGENAKEILYTPEQLNEIESLGGEGYTEMLIEQTRDLLKEDEDDDEQLRGLRRELLDIIDRIFPDQPIAFILEDEEKLALLGVLMDDDTNVDTILDDPAVVKLHEAQREIDAYITTLYAGATHLEGTEIETEISDVHFRVTLAMSSGVMTRILNEPTTNLEKERKIAQLTEFANVSIINNKLELNRIPVTTRDQAQQTASIVHCLPDITQKLKQYTV